MSGLYLLRFYHCSISCSGSRIEPQQIQRWNYSWMTSRSNVGLCDAMIVYSFVTKMAHHIKVKAQDEQSSSSSSSTSSPRRSTTAASVNDDDDDDDEESLLVELCPQFVWSVRDFTLQLDLDGKQATPDEYLERCLQEKPGKTLHLYRLLLCLWRDTNYYYYYYYYCY